jgi:hypothetical protein
VTEGQVADSSPPGELGRLLSSAAAFVAPLSLITALLFYFGYASARAQYDYFGVDVDTIGLSTQDYVMRSPQPLLAPLLVLALLGVSLAVLHGRIRARLQAALANPTAASQRWLTWFGRAVRMTELTGRIALAAGVALLFSYPYLREWVPYPLVTALLTALGAALAAYGSILRAAHGHGTPPGRAAVLSICIVLAASVFWATATLAEWSGRGSARYSAVHLDRLPSVILDTKERLYLTSPGVVERALPPTPGQTFRFRYRRLRLLVQGRDRLFLVPETWSASNSTIVVPMDGSVRVQFQFRNRPP